VMCSGLSILNRGGTGSSFVLEPDKVMKGPQHSDCPQFNVSWVTALVLNGGNHCQALSLSLSLSLYFSLSFSLSLFLFLFLSLSFSLSTSLSLSPSFSLILSLSRS